MRWTALVCRITATSSFFCKTFSPSRYDIFCVDMSDIFDIPCVHILMKFNFAHDYQSLTFFVKSCQDLWVEVKVETHLVGTHRVFLISEIFMFSRSWRTWSSSWHFWKNTICQLSTLSVNCEQKRSYDRLKSASFWWWKKSSYFRTKLFSEL